MSISHFLSVALRKLSLLAKHLPTMPSSYKEAISTLNKLQSNVDYIKHAQIDNIQENNMMEMKKFLYRSGMSFDQLDTLPVIHIAGTNGKGSTCSYCENILRNHGYKTGFYSSPHLLEVRERIRLNGVPISQGKFAEHFWQIYTKLDKEKDGPYDMPLYFRFLTLMALHIFLAEKVDVAILEVGIGGEYDCTNVVRKTVVAGITPLDLDHTALLGNTLESIAWNKAGIMKPGAEVFSAVQSETAMKVLKERSIEKKCKLNVIEDYYSDLGNTRIPQHIQKTNASLALALSRTFIKLRPKNSNNNIIGKEFNPELAKKLIEATRWPGRYEIIPRNNSVYYLDGAHTVESMQVCSEWFQENSKPPDTRKKVLIFNVTGERNPEHLLKLLVECQFETVIFSPNVGVESDTEDREDYVHTINRQMERCHINKEVWQRHDNKAHLEVVPSFAKAVQLLENQNDRQFDVLVTGSLYLIGAALSVLDPTLGGFL